MPVDRAKRSEVASHLAALMRREIGRPEIESLRQRLFPEGWPSDDRLALHSIIRLDRHWRGSRLAVPSDEWDELRRWIAILNTDLDGDQSGYSPDLHSEMPRQGRLAAAGCLVWLLTFAGLAAASQFYDGQLLLIWLTCGLALAPLFLGCWIVQVTRSKEEELSKPFVTFEQMTRFIHHADHYGLPRYDPILHGLPLHVRLSCTWIPNIFRAAIVVLLSITAWPALFFVTWAIRKEQRFDAQHRQRVVDDRRW